MNSTQATAATATGVAAALVIIFVWILGLGHLEVPQPVGLAFITVFTPIVHWLGLRMFGGDGSPKSVPPGQGALVGAPVEPKAAPVP